MPRSLVAARFVCASGATREALVAPLPIFTELCMIIFIYLLVVRVSRKTPRAQRAAVNHRFSLCVCVIFSLFLSVYFLVYMAAEEVEYKVRLECPVYAAAALYISILKRDNRGMSPPMHSRARTNVFHIFHTRSARSERLTLGASAERDTKRIVNVSGERAACAPRTTRGPPRIYAVRRIY